MRSVVQRVKSAQVSVGDRVVGEIGHGLLALVGIASSDGPDDVSYTAGKLRNLRIFEDENGKMNRSVVEVAGSVLVVSQFTLLGDCRKGRRPSFVKAARPEVAQSLYDALIHALLAEGVKIKTGEFQANMQVSLVNDGPVTLVVDSDDKS